MSFTARKETAYAISSFRYSEQNFWNCKSAEMADVVHLTKDRLDTQISIHDFGRHEVYHSLGIAMFHHGVACQRKRKTTYQFRVAEPEPMTDRKLPNCSTTRVRRYPGRARNWRIRRRDSAWLARGPRYLGVDAG